jgi:hypothetical protein
LPGGAPEDRVGDEDALGQACRRQHAVEQLARASHEGRALGVLVGTGRLADRHHLRVGPPPRKHRARGTRVAQRAAFEGRDRSFERIQGLGCRGQRLSLGDRSGKVGRLGGGFPPKLGCIFALITQAFSVAITPNRK